MKKTDRLWWGASIGLALSLLVASLTIVTLSTAIGMELAERYDYSLRCDNASYPYQSLVIKGQCHYATTYGWAKLPLDDVR